jgi:hypothetical protein
MPIKDKIHVAIMVNPIAAMPANLPIIHSPGVTDESSTSMIRFDFSSIMIEHRRICDR